MLKIRRPLGRLIFNMGIAIPGKTVFLIETAPWAPFQNPIRRLIVRSRKVSKARHRMSKWPYRFEIWQAHRQQCCRCACQISEPSKNSKYKSRGFETLRDLTIRRLIGYWNRASGYFYVLGLKSIYISNRVPEQNDLIVTDPLPEPILT